MSRIERLLLARKLTRAVAAAILLITLACSATPSKEINKSAPSPERENPSSKKSAVTSCQDLNFSGSWVVTVIAGDDPTPNNLNSSKFRWEFTDLGGCKWNVKMTSLDNNQSVEKQLTAVADGSGKFRFTNPEMVDMAGTYSESEFSVAHKMNDVRWTYNGKRE